VGQDSCQQKHGKYSKDLHGILESFKIARADSFQDSKEQFSHSSHEVKPSEQD
jgi:hypothetical protein